MTQEDEQIAQRRANLAELERLGVRAYPHRFPRTASISDLVRAHGERTAGELET
jgi:lysyl-tRNA synthetase class II